MQSDLKAALDGFRQEELRVSKWIKNFLSLQITPFMVSGKNTPFKMTVKIAALQEILVAEVPGPQTA